MPIAYGVAYAPQVRLLTPAFNCSRPIIKVISGKIGVVVVVRDWPSGGLVSVAVLGPIYGMSLGAELSIFQFVVDKMDLLVDPALVPRSNPHG